MKDKPLRDLIALSLLACLMFGAKFAMQNIPNVHLGAVLLIALSVLLTLIGGFIPSKAAARKDPVTALRTE